MYIFHILLPIFILDAEKLVRLLCIEFASKEDLPLITLSFFMIDIKYKIQIDSRLI